MDVTWKLRKMSIQWILPGEPRPKKARQCRSNVKVLLIAFFDWQCVVYHEFTQNGQTINNLDVLCRLRKEICKKRPILWRSNSWMLHHDNVPAHRSSLVSDFLEKHGTVTVPQPPNIHQI